MQKLFLGVALALSLLSTSLFISHHSARGAILGAPFIPEVDARFNALEQGQVIKQGYPSASADGPYPHFYVKATYDFAKQGGAVGAYALGPSLPANAVITRSYLYSVTAPTTSASGTLAFSCQTANNIKTATAAASYAAAGASIDGQSTGAASAFAYTTAKCNVTATIATGALTAGKVVAYVEYVVHQ